MRGVGLCLYLLLLMTLSGHLQGQPEGEKEGEGPEMKRDPVSTDMLNGHGFLGSGQLITRQGRSRRPPLPAPRRNPQGSRYSLSLDVPTNILNVLIDLAKNRELRTKAAANAELMARIGRRK